MITTLPSTDVYAIDVEMRKDNKFVETFIYFSDQVPVLNEQVDLFKVTGGKSKQVTGKVTQVTDTGDIYNKYTGWIDLFSNGSLVTTPIYLNMHCYSIVLDIT